MIRHHPTGLNKPELKLSTVGVRSKLSGVATLVTVFVLVSAAAEAQVVTDLFTFTGANSSQNPGLVTPSQGRDGKLYGTTTGISITGGTSSDGSAFKLTTAGNVNVFHMFSGSDGATPDSSLALASDGNFYGTTFSGGSSNMGVLFKIATGGNFAVLHNFSGGADGSSPAGAPTEGWDGNFYGTTSSTVYRYTRDGVFTTLIQFDSSQASGITAPLVQGSDGNLYGTARSGGAHGCGSLFKVSKSGTLLNLHSFPCFGGPVGPVMQASDGNFYGTTAGGGAFKLGTVFQLTPHGTFSTLYSFAGAPNDGAQPFGGLVQGTDGKLYGAAQTGGASGNGALFQIALDGTYRSLYSFTSDIGSSPSAALAQHTNGSFYGTAQGGSQSAGVVYSLDMGLGPFITFVQSTGKVGRAAQILGQGLAGTTGVTFNGVLAATFRVVSDTYLTVVVPSGATTGPVVVTTTTGTFTSNKNFAVK
jgi:uncharacterized repeat protein (TIGR03803 family)